MPGQSGFNLLDVHILAIQDHFTNRATVPVHFVVLNGHAGVEHQIGQMLFELHAKWLRLFWRIYTGQSNFVREMLFIQHGQRVAFTDGSHLAMQGVG